MKKAIVALMLCAVLLLSSCAGFSSADELLTVPTLHKDQDAVKTALEAYTGENAGLKYPISGSVRMPIQFVDLSGDGVEEAIAFFSTPDVDVAQLAVLEKDNKGNWSVVTSVNGLGINVETVNFITIESENTLVLVQWSSNSGERILTPYRFVDSTLKAEPEEKSSRLFVYDLDNDGYDEFLYITSDDDAFYLKYVDPSNSGTSVEPILKQLDSRMSGCVGLVAGRMMDGTNAVFIDESIGIDSDVDSEITYQITEVFTFDGTAFVPAVSDFDIAELSRRPDTDLACRRLFDDYVYIPSVYGPFDDVIGDQWTYWYSIVNGEVEYRLTTYVDLTYQFAMAIPDEWLSGVSMYHDEGTKLWELYGLGVDEKPVVSLCIISVGESVQEYYNNGYEWLDQSGSYRFLIRGTMGEADLDYIEEGLDYIKSNFIIL